MNRRQLLVFLAAGGAGCQWRATTPTPTRSSRQTATPSSRSTETRAPTATSTEEPTPTPTEEPTPTETRTPTRAERARRQIEAARSALGEVVATYGAAKGSDATLLEVDSTVAFEADHLDESLNAVEKHLSRAREFATPDQRITVDRLGRAATWLRHLARAQAAAYTAFGTYADAQDGIFAGDADAAAGAAADLESLPAPITEHLDTAIDAVYVSDVAAVPGVDAETFVTKERQLRQTADAFGFVVDHAESVAEAVGKFSTATDTYVASYDDPYKVSDNDTREYGLAQTQYYEAELALDDASTVLSEVDFSPSTIGRRIDELACSCSSMAEAAAHMQVSAQEAEDRNEKQRKRFLKAAKNDLTGCGDTLEKLAGVKKLENH